MHNNNENGMSSSSEHLKSQLAAISHRFAVRGWSDATSGNYSTRVDGTRILITASSVDKASITEQQIICVDPHGRPLESELQRGIEPSAETLLHCMLYLVSTEINAVAHTHSAAATVLSSVAGAEKQIVISGYEMLKALRGVSSHVHREIIPILENSQDMQVLSQAAKACVEANSGIHAFLIAGHGMYTWGIDLDEARRHVEALEFLLECEYRKLVIK